ncbi:ATP-dependent DNA helicase RecG [Paracidovorax anthurii]|uniref:ATP-dependent DNA helicase RecG n=1 Tax=Paracidovorax anthurii TaxID=78229 RepID=A0A328YQ43_9BURK|nr:ATP-dependent DNA helicase RecG [Paracidovorax anthurii]RAR72647.1 ATP-dependent DNA helicase RecG [Paracidovorax anthurii]
MPAAPSPAQKALQKMGLARDIDLALHLPLRYEDETRITPLRNVRDGETAQIEATVTACEVQLRPRRQLVATVDDGTGTCELRFFSFYPSHQKTLAVGARLRIRGEVKGGFWGRQMLHPAFRVAGGELPAALTPVYPTTAGLPQPYLRRAVVGALQRVDLSETVPADLAPPLARFAGGAAWWTLREALAFLHHPTPDVALATLEDHSHPAWQRLKAEELLAQQLSQLESKRERDRLRAPVLRPGAPPAGGLALHEQLLAALPFGLTAAQRRVCAEIAADLARPVPMHRLLQGDVGSGKTVVAALSATLCMDAGWQCALMAPTEILAEQHFRKLIGWLEPLLAASGRRVAWLAGGQKKKERAAMLALIESGEAALVVGTHAVIQDQVRFQKLALAVIDEQHRFGVAQRLALRKKLEHQGMEPHLLMMSATPIPRTLAMSYYADLDVSTIDELPPGRTPIVTKLIADSRKDEVIERIGAQVAAGRQVYWVCPLIEESEALDLSNATATHVELSEALPGVAVGLLHSRMAPAEKKAVMALFTEGTMGVLVSTTVIEVGVDVPNASLMVIEHAERFGLSQLHQLRGRVGRGAAASACVLLYSTGDSGRLGETARDRLKAMAETNDGFEIARRDLEIRGPGEFLGARQSGAPMLRFADLATDTLLLEWARETAPRMLDGHPELARRHVGRWLGGKSDYLKA